MVKNGRGVRPRAHKRVIKTKKGLKTVMVNQDVKKNNSKISQELKWKLQFIHDNCTRSPLNELLRKRGLL